jgi:hypothetical protein
VVEEALREIVADPAATFQTVPILYQDFLLRCRMNRLMDAALDLSAFRRRLAMARAGLFREGEEGWDEALEIASALPEDMLGVFLFVARAAKDMDECPSDAKLAEVYGTSSPARVRRLLGYMEERGIFVHRIDLTGKRSITIPQLGWTTAPAAPEPESPNAVGKGHRSLARSGLLL